MENLKELLKSLSEKLKNISDTPDLDAEILLSHVLEKDRAFLLSNLDIELTTKQYSKFQNLLARRIKHEPIAYIINQKEFFGLNFYVNKDVLIPRPETELIIKNVIDIVENKDFYSLSKLNILDVGTGSGCIPITLAKNISQAKIHATDISKKALKVAKLNAKSHKVLNRIKFYEGNLLEPIPRIIKFNFIIANLPYVSENQYKNLKDNVRKYEPKNALVAQNYGMEFYIKLLKQAPNYIKNEGFILLEIDPSFKDKITQEVIDILKINKNKIKIKPDLYGFDRVLIIKL